MHYRSGRGIRARRRSASLCMEACKSVPRGFADRCPVSRPIGEYNTRIFACCQAEMHINAVYLTSARLSARSFRAFMHPLQVLPFVCTIPAFRHSASLSLLTCRISQAPPLSPFGGQGPEKTGRGRAGCKKGGGCSADQWPLQARGQGWHRPYPPVTALKGRASRGSQATPS